jgi:hypothetical protein
MRESATPSLPDTALRRAGATRVPAKTTWRKMRLIPFPRRAALPGTVG